MSNVRKRTASASSASTAENLPPPRQSNAMKPVSAPLTHTRLNRLIYLLVLLTALLGAYYSYRTIQYKTNVGGWFNLVLGRHPQKIQTPPNTRHTYTEGLNEERGKAGRRNDEQTVEESINALARVLGMPSKDLASAIAVAVKEYVPPASLSSIAAQETGPAVQAMLNGGVYEHVKVEPQNAQSTGVVGGVKSGMDSFVGMDEP